MPRSLLTSGTRRPELLTICRHDYRATDIISRLCSVAECGPQSLNAHRERYPLLF